MIHTHQIIYPSSHLTTPLSKMVVIQGLVLATINLPREMLILTYPTSISCPRWNFVAIFDTRKLESRAIVRCGFRDHMFNRFGTVPACELWRTDRQTDGQTHNDSTYRASTASRGNKCVFNRTFCRSRSVSFSDALSFCRSSSIFSSSCMFWPWKRSKSLSI